MPILIASSPETEPRHWHIGSTLQLARENLKSVGSEAPMPFRLTRRFWSEIVLGVASSATCAATALSPQWLEMLTGAAPDGGDGSVEWGWAIALAVVAFGAFGVAGREARLSSSVDPPA